MSKKTSRLKQQELSLIENNLTNEFFIKKVKLLATSLFKYEGLPNLMPERFIEKMLYRYGQVAIYKDSNLGIIASHCIPCGEMNHYDEPTAYTLEGINYYKSSIPSDEIAIIRNTDDSTPMSFFANYFANKMGNASRSQDINIMLQKFPALVQCEESQKLTLQILFEEYNSNTPFIFANKNLDLSGLSVIDLNAPFIADKFSTYINSVWCDCLSFFGVNNSNTMKKERLNTDEVNSNNQETLLEGDKFLKERVEGIERANELFGLNMGVERREQIIPFMEMQIQPEEGE